MPGLPASVHCVSHSLQPARFWTTHHDLVDGRSSACDLLGDGRANVCRPGNGHRQAVSGHFPPPHCGQDVAPGVDLGVNGEPVHCLGHDGRALLDPAATIKIHL